MPILPLDLRRKTHLTWPVHSRGRVLACRSRLPNLAPGLAGHRAEFVHAEALHELSREEFVELAEIRYKLAQVMRQDTRVEKEYMACFSEASGFNHIHVHFVPRPKDLARELKGPSIFALLKVDEGHEVPPHMLWAFCEDYREKFMAP